MQGTINPTGYKTYAVDLPLTGWTAQGEGYVRTVNVTGLRAGTTPIVQINTGSSLVTASTYKAIQKAFSKIWKVEITNDAMIVYSLAVPSTTVPMIVLEVK